MLIQVFQIAAVAWLPGAVLYRLPVGNRAARAELDPEERLFWAVILSLAITLAVVVALAFFGFYTFGRLLIADALIALGAAAVGRFNLRLGSSRRPTLSVVLPLALILLGGWRFFPPSEFVLGGKDPGVYINEGLQIAQRRTFLYDDPLVTAMPPFARDLFFRSDHRPEFYGLRFMGFPLLDIDSGTVVGQFPHLFPASIAVAYGIDGLTGARRIVGIWAILGLLAIYFLGARLFGGLVGFAGATLLALNIAEVWFARYPNAEVVMQTFVFAALLATVHAFDEDDDWFFAAVAGSILGLLLFLRFDAALAIAGVLGGLALLAATGRPWRWSFLVPLAVLASLAALYMAGPMRPYADRYIIYFRILSWWQHVLIFLAVAVVTSLAVMSRRDVLGARLRALVPQLLTAALVAGAIYALYFRHPAGKLAAHDAYALRTVTEYYLTLPALIAALVGYALAARRIFWRAPAFFTTIALFSFFFFYKIYVVPDHFWMARRYVPVILPAALLLASVAALGTRGGPSVLRPLRWTIGVIFLVLIGREYARVSDRILDHVEYAGIIPRLERLASSIGDSDLLIVESMDAQTDVHTMAVPLAYIYARNVLVFTSAAPDKADFAGFLEWASQKYTRVLFLGAGGTDLLSREWGSRVVSSDRFRVPEFVGAAGEFPRQARVKQFDYTIYEFTPPVADEVAGEIAVDLGTEDDLNVLRFHAKEETEGRTFRWSQDVSYITLNGLNGTQRLLTLWMSNGGRPDSAPPAIVTVYLDDERIGSATVKNGFNPYTFELAPALAARVAAARAPARFRLTTTVWSPETALGTSDDRELGVMVDRVALK